MRLAGATALAAQLLSIAALVTCQIPLKDEDIKLWIGKISDDLSKLREQLGADILEKAFSANGVRATSVDVSSATQLLRKVQGRIENFLWKSESNVKSIRIQAENSYASYTPKNYSCGDFTTYPYLRAAAIVKKEPTSQQAAIAAAPPANATTSANWTATPNGMMPAAPEVTGPHTFCEMEATLELTPDPRLYNVETNRANSTSHVPPNIFDASNEILNVANWTNNLDAVFIANAKSDPTLKWQYFGTTEGMFKIYPGIQWFVQTRNYTQKDMPIDFFDCRTQYWYLLAATYPKDMIVLIDNSGSMKGSGSIMANKTLTELLYTLSVNDFFNVIMFMNMSIKYMSNSFNRTMLQATEMNKNMMMEIISRDEARPYNLRQFAPHGVSDFRVALVEAFELLRLAKNGTVASSGGVQTVMLVTDSAPENFADVFEQCNPDRQVRLFTFLIGQEATDKNIVKGMACNNRGFFVQISTLADVKENVQRYIPVMARTNAQMLDYFFVWTGVHQNQIKTQNPAALYAHAIAPPARPAEATAPPSPDFGGFTAFPLSGGADNDTGGPAPPSTSPAQAVVSNASETTTAQPQLPPTQQPALGRSLTPAVPAYRIKGDISEHQIKEEDPRVKNKLFASVAQAAYDIRTNETILTGFGQLIGVAGLDVPVDQFERLGPAWELGPLGYIFMVTNNGFILFHPEFRPISSSGNMQMFYNNKDISELEHPADSRPSGNTPSYDQALRIGLVRRSTGYVDIARIKTYDDMRRGFRQQFRYFYAPLNSTSHAGNETRETPFSLGLALPWNLSKRWPHAVDYRGPAPVTHSFTLADLTSRFSESLANASCDPNPGAYKIGLSDYEFCEFPGELLAQYNTNPLCALATVLLMNQSSQAAIKCSTDFLSRIVTDASVTRAVQDAWQAADVATLYQVGAGLLYLWTGTGLARWHFARGGEPIDASYAAARRNGSRDSLYEKTVLLMSSDPQMAAVLTGPSGDAAASSWSANLSLPVQLTSVLRVSGGASESAVVGVIGAELNYDRLAEYFAATTSRCANPRSPDCQTCASGNVRCYLLDGGGFVVVSEARDDVGKSFDHVNCPAMRLMVESGLFVTLDSYDFQAVCIRKIEVHGSASAMFSPIRALMRLTSWVLIEGFLLLSDLSSSLFQAIHSMAQDAVAGRTPSPEDAAPSPSPTTRQLPSLDECRRVDASRPEGVRQMRERVDGQLAAVAQAVSRLSTAAEKTDQIKQRLMLPICVSRPADDEIEEAACAYLCQRLTEQFGMGLVTELLGNCPQSSETPTACALWRTLLQRSEQPLPTTGALRLQCQGLGLCEACPVANGSFYVYVRQVEKTNLLFVAVTGDPNCDCSGCSPIVATKDLTEASNATHYQPYRERPPWTRDNIVLTDNATVCSSRGTRVVDPMQLWLAIMLVLVTTASAQLLR